MQGEQLELQFDSAVTTALHDPETADLSRLCQVLEHWLAALPAEVHLHIAGEGIARIAEVYATRAEHLFSTWEAAYNPHLPEPILTADMLSGFLRQSMTLNIEQLFETPELHRRSPRTVDPEESLAGEVDKAAILEMVDELQESAEKEQALAVAHHENVSAWIAAIAHSLNSQTGEAIALRQLLQNLGMPLIEVWLALLLSGYRLEQRGDFYEFSSIYVYPHEGNRHQSV